MSTQSPVLVTSLLLTPNTLSVNLNFQTQLWWSVLNVSFKCGNMWAFATCDNVLSRILNMLSEPTRAWRQSSSTMKYTLHSKNNNVQAMDRLGTQFAITSNDYMTQKSFNILFPKNLINILIASHIFSNCLIEKGRLKTRDDSQSKWSNL